MSEGQPPVPMETYGSSSLSGLSLSGLHPTQLTLPLSLSFIFSQTSVLFFENAHVLARISMFAFPLDGRGRREA